MEEAIAESRQLANRLVSLPKGAAAALEALGLSAGVAARLVLPVSTPATERLRTELADALRGLSLALVRHADANGSPTDQPSPAASSLAAVQTMVARLAELGRASMPADVPFASGCLLALQAVATAASRADTFAPGIVASAWNSVTETCTEWKEPLRAVAERAAVALADLAGDCAARLCEACEERDAKLCAFGAQNVLKLAVRVPGAGEAAFPAVLRAAVTARLADVAAGGALRDAAIPRLDGAMYRTLEASAEPQRLLQLLAELVREGASPQQASCRLQILCAVALQRAGPQQSPSLRLAVLLQLLPLAWREAAARASPVSLARRGGEADALLDALRRGAGAALRCAAADAQSQPEAWRAAHRALLGAALSPLPLERELALDAWAGLVACSPPACAQEHADGLAAMLHCACDARPSGTRASRRRTCGALAAAHGRLLDARPDAACVGDALDVTLASACTPAGALLLSALPLNRVPVARLAGAVGARLPRLLAALRAVPDADGGTVFAAAHSLRALHPHFSHDSKVCATVASAAAQSLCAWQDAGGDEWGAQEEVAELAAQLAHSLPDAASLDALVAQIVARPSHARAASWLLAPPLIPGLPPATLRQLVASSLRQPEDWAMTAHLATALVKRVEAECTAGRGGGTEVMALLPEEPAGLLAHVLRPIQLFGAPEAAWVAMVAEPGADAALLAACS